MNCPDVQDLLHPYADGELDLVRHLELEGHLAGCPECAEQEKRLRSLRATLTSPSLYYRAPAALRARIQHAAPAVRAPRLGRRLALAAGVLLLIGASVATGVLLSGRGSSPDQQLAEWVVADHIRSLQVDHLTDVASTDQHTVKPWFQGKLDFALPVPDLAPQGYVLSGGRLDYLPERSVAALVYLRRSHAINLFTWPAAGDEEQPVRALSRQGFHVRHWLKSGMTWWAVSDLNDEELDEFVRLFQDRSRTSHP